MIGTNSINPYRNNLSGETMSLIGETSLNGLEIQLHVVGPQSDAAVPTLGLAFRISNNSPEEIILFPFHYEAKVERPRTIGLGAATTFLSITGINSSARISSGKKITFFSILELGYDKLMILRNIVKKDLFLKAELFGMLFKEKKGKIQAYDYGCEISNIKIPESMWIEWLSDWIGDLKTLIISGELWKNIDDLKKRMGIKEDEALIKELYDHYIYKLNLEK